MGGAEGRPGHERGARRSRRLRCLGALVRGVERSWCDRDPRAGHGGHPLRGSIGPEPV